MAHPVYAGLKCVERSPNGPRIVLKTELQSVTAISRYTCTYTVNGGSLQTLYTTFGRPLYTMYGQSVPEICKSKYNSVLKLAYMLINTRLFLARLIDFVDGPITARIRSLASEFDYAMKSPLESRRRDLFLLFTRHTQYTYYVLIHMRVIFLREFL